jgi:hypothetical protein
LYLIYQPIGRGTVAFFIAFTGFLLQVLIFVHQKKYEKSGFRLTSALDTFEEAHKILKDKTNDRVKWVTAARALQRGNRIASGITEQVHNDVLEVHRDRYRGMFGDLLGYYNQGVTGSFFYGAPPNIVDIDEAAKHSSKRENGDPKLRKLGKIPYYFKGSFAQFPFDYEDSLSDIEPFSDQEVNEYFNIMKYQGLFDYLQHTRKFHSTDGQLFRRSPSKTELSPSSVWWKKIIGYFRPIN